MAAQGAAPIVLQLPLGHTGSLSSVSHITHLVLLLLHTSPTWYCCSTHLVLLLLHTSPTWYCCSTHLVLLLHTPGTAAAPHITNLVLLLLHTSAAPHITHLVLLLLLLLLMMMMLRGPSAIGVPSPALHSLYARPTSLPFSPLSARPLRRSASLGRAPPVPIIPGRKAAAAGGA